MCEDLLNVSDIEVRFLLFYQIKYSLFFDLKF